MKCWKFYPIIDSTNLKFNKKVIFVIYNQVSAWLLQLSKINHKGARQLTINFRARATSTLLSQQSGFLWTIKLFDNKYWFHKWKSASDILTNEYNEPNIKAQRSNYSL